MNYLLEKCPVCSGLVGGPHDQKVHEQWCKENGMETKRPYVRCPICFRESYHNMKLHNEWRENCRGQQTAEEIYADREAWDTLYIADDQSIT